jgi:glycerol-3-phosphate acyltransferase PlsY
LLSYLAGGIPTGYLVARRLKSIDIRDHGSGNPGTANVYRVAGPLAGALTLIVDALKGYLPVMLAQRYFPDRQAFIILCGAAAIIGHDWTIFLRFQGGKGVATSAGVFAALLPKPLGLTLLFFVGGLWASGHISVASMTGAVALPLLSFMSGSPPAYSLAALAACLLILYKHVPNLMRLMGSRETLLPQEGEASQKPVLMDPR